MKYGYPSVLRSLNKAEMGGLTTAITGSGQKGPDI